MSSPLTFYVNMNDLFLNLLTQVYVWGVSSLPMILLKGFQKICLKEKGKNPICKRRSRLESLEWFQGWPDTRKVLCSIERDQIIRPSIKLVHCTSKWIRTLSWNTELATRGSEMCWERFLFNCHRPTPLQYLKETSLPILFSTKINQLLSSTLTSWDNNKKKTLHYVNMGCVLVMWNELLHLNFEISNMNDDSLVKLKKKQTKTWYESISKLFSLSLSFCLSLFYQFGLNGFRFIKASTL